MRSPPKKSRSGVRAMESMFAHEASLNAIRPPENCLGQRQNILLEGRFVSSSWCYTLSTMWWEDWWPQCDMERGWEEAKQAFTCGLKYERRDVKWSRGDEREMV